MSYFSQTSNHFDIPRKRDSPVSLYSKITCGLLSTRARLTTHDPPPMTHLPSRFSHPQKKDQFVTHISTHTYLADFLKTNLGKFAAMHLSEKGPKGRFFAPDKLDNHTIGGKGKNKQIERAKKKKGGGKEKAMVAPIVLTFSTLEIAFW